MPCFLSLFFGLVFFSFPHLPPPPSALAAGLPTACLLLPIPCCPALPASLPLRFYPSSCIANIILVYHPQEISVKSARLLPSSSWNHSPSLSLSLSLSLTYTILCALEFSGELVYLIALGLLLSAIHSEYPFLDASC